MNKLEQLLQLGKLRQKAHRNKYKPIPSEYDFGFVSPITKSAQNLDSSTMIILQDWASTDGLKTKSLERAKLGYTPSLPTNRNLDNLLKQTFSKSREYFYITNLFPLVKGGKMNEKISDEDYNWAFQNFCFKEVQIVKPKFVVCIGKNVFKTFHQSLITSKKEYTVGENFHSDGIIYFYQTHTGALPFNKRNKLNTDKNQVLLDWKQMFNFMNTPFLNS